MLAFDEANILQNSLFWGMRQSAHSAILARKVLGHPVLTSFPL